MNKRILDKFIKMNNHLKLADAEAMHKELHKISDRWYIFYNTITNNVEVHDAYILNPSDLIDSHVMTEKFLSWKIVFDAKKYNTNVFDVNEKLDEADRIEEANDVLRKNKDSLARLSIARGVMYGGYK